MSYADFQTRIARINDVLCALNILAWDSRTKMPPGGVDARAEQVATLTVLAREMATSQAMADTLKAAQDRDFPGRLGRRTGSQRLRRLCAHAGTDDGPAAPCGAGDRRRSPL